MLLFLLTVYFHLAVLCECDLIIRSNGEAQKKINDGSLTFLRIRLQVLRVNWPLPSLHGGSLEIRLTVALSTKSTQERRKILWILIIFSITPNFLLKI